MNALKKIDRTLLNGIARLVQEGVWRQYPSQPGHVVMSVADLRAPKDMHPAFFGCFDWHSAVHSHWTMLKLLELNVDLPDAQSLGDTLAEHLSQRTLQGEMAYFLEPGREAFERPYGWAWIWKLAADLALSPILEAKGWQSNIRPLSELLADRFSSWLDRQIYPSRAGTHSNTAFAISFGLEYAQACHRPDFDSALRAAAKRFYGGDRCVSFCMEPSGNDFISPLLAEIDLMGRVLPAEEWMIWLENFLAKIDELYGIRPVAVSDRADGQGVHLDGLNLSRAWHLALISARMETAGQRPAAVASEIANGARQHWDAGIKHIFSGDFHGEHWLGTFAVLAANALRPHPET